MTIQNPDVGRLQQEAFDITPTTVYGFVVGFLVVVIIALCVAIVIQDRRRSRDQENYHKMVHSTVRSMDLLRAELDDDANELKQRKMLDHIRAIFREELGEIKRKTS